MSRRGLIMIFAIVVLAFLAVRGIVAWQDTNPTVSKASASNGPVYESRTIAAGAVEVKLEPQRIDASGAAIKLTFDTHSVDLGFDLTKTAHLTVSGQPWPATTWSGDGPGGHHREGTVQFSSAGPAIGTADLHLDGLPAPVASSWSLEGS